MVVPAPSRTTRRANGVDLRGRWQATQLIGPVFELAKRSATRAEFDHHAYDLVQLALRAIDYVVTNQASLDGFVSPDRLVDHLSGLARRMRPDDPDRPWSQVAKQTLASLLHDGRPHVARWVELAEGDEEVAQEESFQFRLLRLVDAEEGTALVATDEAIVVYLQGLASDLTSEALARKLIVEIQMAQGEFEKALQSAREATRVARGLSAQLRERLDDTRRDVRSVDWSGDMVGWLRSIATQASDQIERDRQLTELAERSGEAPEAAHPCRRIVEEVRRSEQVWVGLEQRVQQAIPLFLESQAAQRFQPRGLSAVYDLTEALLGPALVCTDETMDELAALLVAGVGAPHLQPQWGLDELAAQLLRPPSKYDRLPSVLDDPGELGEPLGAAMSDEVAEEARRVMEHAGTRPHRLSELLAKARSASIGEQTRLEQVVWGCALYAFVTQGEVDPSTLPDRPDLAVAVARLAACDDETILKDRRFDGPDLIVGTVVGLDLIDITTLEDAS